MKGKNTKVAVAMSGGVDSSVATAILKEQGYECFGVHLDLGTQSTPKNIADAKKIAAKLEIPFHVIDLKKKFHEKVVNYYLKAYKKGETPNPCVVCNPEIKFGELLKKVKKMGADFIATGHYARIKNNELHAGVDKKKDQSYFLYRLTQDKLKHILFPLGEQKKPKTRRIARKLGLSVAEERDESQGICFIPDKFYTDFLKKNLPKSYFKEGLIIDTQGNKKGRHRGLPFYTCGQRRGLRIGGLKDPLYVVKTDHKNNKLIVGEDEELWHKEIYAHDLSFISGKIPKKPFKCRARIRHLSRLEPATVKVDGDHAIVRFPKPVRAFTEGQSIVFYKGTKVIGGGVMRFTQQ